MKDSQIYSNTKKYKQFVLSQEKDIQALKAALSSKNRNATRLDLISENTSMTLGHSSWECFYFADSISRTN